MIPLEILQQELKKLESAKRHSKKDYEKGQISKELHEIHIKNLEPKIKKYEFAIILLKQYMED